MSAIECNLVTVLSEAIHSLEMIIRLGCEVNLESTSTVNQGWFD